jgi:hypothetical protein
VAGHHRVPHPAAPGVMAESARARAIGLAAGSGQGWGSASRSVPGPVV